MIAGMTVNYEIYGTAQSFDVFNDAERIDAIIQKLIKIIGFVAYGPPLLFKFPAPDCPHEYGCTNIQALTTSHCGIHTWPEYCYAVLVVSTCGDFDCEKVREFLVSSFSAKEIIIQKIGWKGSYACRQPDGYHPDSI